MWLVRTALNRPYTFLVMALMILLGGVLALRRMPTDILPEIDIPVVAVVWSYQGLPPIEMEQRVVSNFERYLTTTVNDIEHTESQTIRGVSVIKVFFHEGAKIEAAVAQITANAQGIVRSLPQGAVPPLIIRYSASNAPVLQLLLESELFSEQQLFDFGVNFVRAGVATVQGAATPYPWGGRNRQVMVDLDLAKLYAWGLSPRDVIDSVGAQNLTLPAGSIKLGETEYAVRLNASPDTIAELNRIPLRTIDGRTVHLEDVANVRDGYTPQTSIVNANGRRAVVMPILRSIGSSTLDVVSRVREALPNVIATIPKEIKVTPIFDQSAFVRSAVSHVVKEAVIAAGLTSLLMLLFLGSLRSTLIVVVSIPLSILVSIILLAATGNSLNVMTLGGMSLAVGILVDDATVELENIHRHRALGKPLVNAIFDGAREIALPAFVSTLCICIVFLPVAFIAGAAKSLFIPLALAVVFAMATSYFLSRTLVPTLVLGLLAHERPTSPKGVFGRIFHAFESGFGRVQEAYTRRLRTALEHPWRVLALIGAVVALSLPVGSLVGRDFFPSVDAGLLRLKVRAAPGTRIEETEQLFSRVRETVKEVIPSTELVNVLENIGVTTSPINLSMTDGTFLSSADGEILIGLRPGLGRTREYARKLRVALKEAHPEATFFFSPPDLATQVLNFGISAPIDIQLVGPPANRAKNLAIAREIQQAVSHIPGIVDVRLHQVPEAPEMFIEVDRDLTNQIGLTQRDVANDLLISLSSSGQTTPSYWLDPLRGIQYSVAAQTPQYRMATLNDLQNTPIGARDGALHMLGNVANFQRSTGPTNITHLNSMPTYDVLANVDGIDLGTATSALEDLVASVNPRLPRGSKLALKGQIESMQSSFRGLGYGLVLAVLLVYLVMVMNFQSWLDPFVILLALPGAGVGIIWMLFLSGTTLSVPALMGTILCVGVATANGILVVSFANDLRREASTAPLDARSAALRAGTTRLRPVLMTAAAMITGMLPMALGFGEGAEQNAPLGRAVIGGLALATLFTLFFIPVAYSVLRRKPPKNFLESRLEAS